MHINSYVSALLKLKVSLFLLVQAIKFTRKEIFTEFFANVNYYIYIAFQLSFNLTIPEYWLNNKLHYRLQNKAKYRLGR